jgi:type IV pilus assembly protein PilW
MKVQNMRSLGSRTVTKHASVQLGLSLVELLVGITIGLFVVIAALGSLAFTQVASTSVGDSARLQQKADSVFRTMGFQVRQAGGVEVIWGASGVVQYDTSFTGYGGSGDYIQGDEGASGAPDKLRLSYQDNGVVRDCLGNNGSGGRLDIEFWVDAGRLKCKGTTGAGEVIADGVEDFQVTYGSRIVRAAPVPQAAVLVASGAAGPPIPRVAEVADYQQFKADVAPFKVAPYVQSVTVCLRLRGDLASDSSRIASVAGCDGVAVAADGYIRRVFRNTFSVRSALL